jgi:hypothetical protein
MEYKIIKTPMCSYKDCSSPADYALTDLILADKDKPIKDRKLKTITVANSCDRHFDRIKQIYDNDREKIDFGPPYSAAQWTTIDEQKAKNE